MYTYLLAIYFSKENFSFDVYVTHRGQSQLVSHFSILYYNLVRINILLENISLYFFCPAC